MGQAQLGLGQQLQQIWHGRRQADFHHSPGHGADIGDAGQIQPQRRVRLRIQRLLQGVARGFAGNAAAIGPDAISQTEDIVPAIGGDDPAVGKGRDHPAFLVQPHEPLRGGAAHESGSRRKAWAGGERRIGNRMARNLPRLADHHHLEGIAVPRMAPCQAKAGHQTEAARRQRHGSADRAGREMGQRGHCPST